jgi:histidinol dehydrogenase
VRLERRTLTGDPTALVAELRRLVAIDAAVGAKVEQIAESIRARGDEALDEWRFGLEVKGGTLRDVRVEAQELRSALDGLDASVREGLEVAIANVRAVAEAGVDAEREVELPHGQRVALREVPVARAAVYVPGGRAPYPSTVVMGVVTARAAGVEQVVVCTPAYGGGADPEILAACALAGADEVYRMGGAQAIAALAYGTEKVPAVDVIVGPGGRYVQEAKRRLSAVVGIDGFAGPSDLLLILTAEPQLAALDLRAQAEHGEDSLVVAVSPDRALLDVLEEQLDGAPEPAPCVLVETTDLDGALALAEAFAPEHLQLIGSGAEALAPRVTRAGCLFVGAGAATAFGDYVAGSNHVLPTDGAARFASGLSARTFRRRMAEVRIPPEAAAALAPYGAAIARAEGFGAHAESMEARIRENGAR